MGLTFFIFDVVRSCGIRTGMFIKLRTLLGNTAHAQMLLPVRLVAHACRCQQCGHNIIFSKATVSRNRYTD